MVYGSLKVQWVLSFVIIIVFSSLLDWGRCWLLNWRKSIIILITELSLDWWKIGDWQKVRCLVRKSFGSINVTSNKQQYKPIDFYSRCVAVRFVIWIGRICTNNNQKWLAALPKRLFLQILIMLIAGLRVFSRVSNKEVESTKLLLFSLYDFICWTSYGKVCAGNMLGSFVAYWMLIICLSIEHWTPCSTFVCTITQFQNKFKVFEIYGLFQEELNKIENNTYRTSLYGCSTIHFAGTIWISDNNRACQTNLHLDWD